MAASAASLLRLIKQVAGCAGQVPAHARDGALHLHEDVCLLLEQFAVDLEPQVLQADATVQDIDQLGGINPAGCKPT